MGLVAVLRRRWRLHPSAMAAVIATLMLCLLVVASLRAFAGGIADASVRSSVLASTEEARLIRISTTLRPDRIAEVGKAVEQLSGRIEGRRVYAARVATSRGLAGGAAKDRIQLAESPDIAAVARLTAGAWPTLRTDAPIPIAVPEAAATALGWQLGTRADLTDLIDDQAGPLEVEVVGVYAVSDPASPLWSLLPLALTGVAQGDFTQYGPMIVPAATLSTQTSATFAVDVPPDGLNRATAASAAGAADIAIAELKAAPAMANATVRGEMPQVLRAAAALGDRTDRVLYTPMLLLLLLGGAALALSVGQLAMLRDSETRLLRTRGASTGQLLLLALAEALVVIGVSAAAALLLAPLVVARLAHASGFEGASASYRHTLQQSSVWGAVATGAALALVVYLAASLRHGQLRVERDASGRSKALSVLTGAGLDVALLLLGALGVVQLRRYAGKADQGTIDALTLAAPVLVIGGLCVVALRLIPLLARAGSRWAAGGDTLGRAWAGWQVARRMSTQAGSVLLVLLCLTMGSLAVSQKATVDRSMVDQSAFETGAPLRVALRGPAFGDPGMPAVLADAAGGADRAMRVYRESIDVGGLRGVSLLAADVRAGQVMTPRTDLLSGAAWSDLIQRLVPSDQKPVGVEIPEGTTELTVQTRTADQQGFGDNGLTAQLVLADAAGQWFSLPLEFTSGEQRVSLTAPAPGFRGPVRLVGLTLDGLYLGLMEESLRPRLTMSSVTAGSTSLELGTFAGEWRGATWVFAPPMPDPGPVPVLMTRDLASTTKVGVGAELKLTMVSSARTAKVVGLIDALPTATNPHLGVLADLGVVQRAAGASGDSVSGIRRLTATEYWLDPVDPAHALTALAADRARIGTIIDRNDVLAARQESSVNAGMRTAMGVLTAAALLLATLGFAAATTALATQRRQEGVVLTALGYSPRAQRRVLLVERTVVVALTAVVGIAVAALSSWLVMPLLVSGDGHAQVPPVVLAFNWPALLILVAGVSVVLVAVAALLVRGPGDLSAQLRAQEGE